ncbi:MULTISPECIES: carbohydrate ABC transporter permease [Blautia]|uniref:carbohydrate ABC transporter permease n=1 Tax=Blautia TaxID=572511 RepID=UPI000BA434D2|nr:MULTISPECIES: carbohydrate ABC transporter permease [Blautia]
MKKIKPVNVIIYILAFLVVAFSVLPFLWTVSTSLKTGVEVYSAHPTFLPHPVTLENYIAVFNDANMMKSFANTVKIAAISTIISTVVSVLSAYGFSRYRFPGNKTLLTSILFTRLLPRVTLLVPFYVTLSRLKLVNTYTGLTLLYLVVGIPTTIWLMKGFIDGLPYEVEEAAVVDGCNPLQVLTKVVVPMVKPAIATVAMFSFILSWNEFLFPLLMAKDRSIRPIAVSLAFYIDESGIRWGPLMAASVIMSVPAIIFFSVAQKHLVAGLSEGAVKG